MDFVRAFQRIDKDGNGYVTVAEFRTALGDLVTGLSTEDLKLLAAHFDMDGERNSVVVLHPSFHSLMVLYGAPQRTERSATESSWQRWSE